MQFNGNLMVGKAHTAQLSLEPGAASGAFRPAGCWPIAAFRQTPASPQYWPTP